MLGLATYAADRQIAPKLDCAVLTGAGVSGEGSAEHPVCGAARRWDQQRGALLGSGSALLGLGLTSVTVSVAFGVRRSRSSDEARAPDEPRPN